MALFDWLRRKSNDERQKEFVEKIINKYIGSRANLFKDAQELLLTTKFGLTEQEMSAQEFLIKAMLKEVSWAICLLDSAET